MKLLDNKKINLLEFIPKNVVCGKKFKEYDLNIEDKGIYLILHYFTDIINKFKGRVGKRRYSLIIPKYVSRNNETFEVLGLLQAEMCKTQRGCLTFANHEYQLINKVMAWFDKEIGLKYNDWRWYTKININEPKGKKYRKKVEEKVINHWTKRTHINIERGYPKIVSYIKNTNNKKLKYYDYGTLIIEYKNNIVSQIIKKYVHDLSYDILKFTNEDIRRFMRGIIAGESNVEIDINYKKFRVHLTATQKVERDLYKKCFERLEIYCKQYKDYKGMVISKKQNHLKLFQQKLMFLSPKKYNKFLRLLTSYPKFKELEEYKKSVPSPPNKIPQEVIDEIIRLHYGDPKAPAWKIAQKVGVSDIKVQRVRKEQGLSAQKLKRKVFK